MFYSPIIDPTWSAAIVEHDCLCVVQELLRKQWVAAAKFVKASGPVPRVASYRECLAWHAASQPTISIFKVDRRCTFPMFVEVWGEIYLTRTSESPEVAQQMAEEFFRENHGARGEAIRRSLGLGREQESRLKRLWAEEKLKRSIAS